MTASLLALLLACSSLTVDSGAGEPIDTASNPCYATCYDIAGRCGVDEWSSVSGVFHDPYAECIAQCDLAVDPSSWAQCYSADGWPTNTPDACGTYMNDCGAFPCGWYGTCETQYAY